MNLQRIRLKHFRQFYGDQTIEIAPPGERNVTLVHAENGVGKTTLLNSVLWALFGEEATTKRFEQRDKIINFQAEKEGDRTASVEVVFQHENVSYLASRSHTVTSGGYVQRRFAVMKMTGNGALSEPLPNPDAFINTVIPGAMAPYFFFDGEQAETFSSEANHKAIAAAIRDILGSTLIETAIADLKYVARKFNEEIGDRAGDQEIKALERRISELEANKEGWGEIVVSLGKEIEAYETQLTDIANRLKEAQAAAQYQTLRETKQQQLSIVQSQLLETRSEILRWIPTKGISMISSTLTSQSLDFIDEESLKGRIPSPYNEEFVKGLLQAKKCICERPLDAASPEWRAVTSLLTKAGNAEVLSRVVRVRARTAMLKELREDAPRLLQSAEEKLARLLEQQNTLEREIEEIGKKLEALPIAEIQERERARKELEKKMDSAKTERIRKQRDIEHANEEITRLNRQVGDLALKNTEARKLVLRRELADTGAEFLQSYLGVNEQEARKDIQDVVNRILEETARRHYRFEIDEGFQIRLLFQDGTPTPKSGGENQMMSLAFIAALVQFADKRSKQDENGLFVPATVAPLILDSPFGQLDDAYRSATAAFVPKMAPQVVLLVSSSQGKEEVTKALEHRVGAEYVLVMHNEGAQDSKKQDFLTFRGKKIATTLFNRERNMTEIRKAVD